MHRQQHFLEHVLEIVRARIQALAQKTSKVPAQLLQEQSISLRIAVQSCHQQALQRCFTRTQQFTLFSSVHPRLWLQGTKRK
ncbi:hypothetical protein D3C77_679760 [compost metagenome]